MRSAACPNSSALVAQACASSSAADAAMTSWSSGIVIRWTAKPAARSAPSTAASTAGSASIASRPTVRGASAATANPGSSSAIPAISPSTSAAIGPTVSRLGASGRTPSRLIRPQVVFSPAIPQHAAGMRIEPPVSVPKATSASPAATAVAEPLDEPPGTRRGSSGLTGVPKASLTPVIP